MVSAVVSDGVSIGPFAHLRPAAEIGRGCHIGNFVEVKKSRLGEGSKVNHLSYIGDAELGEQVNVGAGTITANYDGVRKHQRLWATAARPVQIHACRPVTIGNKVTIGAGSTISRMPDGALAIGRSNR